MEQLDKWNKEMRRLSVAKFAETDDALYNYYKGALKDLKAEVKQYIDTYETLSFSKRLEVDNRLKTANRIDAILNDLNQWSDAEIRRYIENEMEVGYYGTWYALEGAENVQLDFGMLPENYIETLVNQKVNGQTFSKRLYAHRDELAERVTTSLLNNAVNSKGYAYAAKEVGELTEANYKQALRIARTEGGRAQSTAKQKAYKEATDKGVEMEKRWLSTLDKKTRHSHQELDGQTEAVDGKFKFNGYTADGPRLFGRASLDINCRCTTIAVVNGIAPEIRKDNLTGENIAYTNYNDWYKSKATQAVIGKQKYADYVGKLAKKYGTNDFSKLLDRMTDKEYEQLNIIDVTGLPEEVIPAKSAIDTMKEAFLHSGVKPELSMKAAYGDEIFSSILKTADGIEDERIARMYAKYAERTNFHVMERFQGGLADYHNVNMNLKAFAGTKSMKENQVFFHEFAHAIDSLALKDIEGVKDFAIGAKKKHKVFGEYDVKISNYSAMKKFDLKKKISADLDRYILGDIPTAAEFKRALGKKPTDQKALKEYVDKISDHDELIWGKEDEFKAKIKALGKENPYLLPDLSDIVEATKKFGAAPFGAGHGSDYWKITGNTEAEFFAEVTDSIATNKEGFELLKEIFPNAIDTYFEIVDDILKAGE